MTWDEVERFKQGIVSMDSAAGSSNAGIYFSPKDGGPLKPITISTDQRELNDELSRFLEANPKVLPDQCMLLVNNASDAVDRALEALKSLVAGTTMSYVMSSLILSMGTAVSIQLGRHVRGRGGKGDVFSQMQEIGVPAQISESYSAVHKYHRASKHADKPDHKTLSEEISHPGTGPAIAMRYCRAAHDLLNWLVVTSLGHPPMHSLTTIDGLLRQRGF